MLTPHRSLAPLAVQAYLDIQHVRVALPAGATDAASVPVATVAVCTGSGGAVIGSAAADCLLTGEMGHHEILAAAATGRSVVLCEHAATERGYLRVASAQLADLLGLPCMVSEQDKDPLRVH